ncbi:unnamed protein product [Scytosiphon promiscuus]
MLVVERAQGSTSQRRTRVLLGRGESDERFPGHHERFAHIPAGIGTHKNPTASQAFEAARHADTSPISHGRKGRDASSTSGKPVNIEGHAPSMRLALPMNALEREIVVRYVMRGCGPCFRGA